jgi:hypothetical protein
MEQLTDLGAVDGQAPLLVRNRTMPLLDRVFADTALDDHAVGNLASLTQAAWARCAGENRHRARVPVKPDRLTAAVDCFARPQNTQNIDVSTQRVSRRGRPGASGRDSDKDPAGSQGLRSRRGRRTARRTPNCS